MTTVLRKYSYFLFLFTTNCQNLLILVPLDIQSKCGFNDIFIIKFDLTVHILYGVTIILRKYLYFLFLFTTNYQNLLILVPLDT